MKLVVAITVSVWFYNWWMQVPVLAQRIGKDEPHVWPPHIHNESALSRDFWKNVDAGVIPIDTKACDGHCSKCMARCRRQVDASTNISFVDVHERTSPDWTVAVATEVTWHTETFPMWEFNNKNYTKVYKSEEIVDVLKSKCLVMVGDSLVRRISAMLVIDALGLEEQPLMTDVFHHDKQWAKELNEYYHKLHPQDKETPVNCMDFVWAATIKEMISKLMDSNTDSANRSLLKSKSESVKTWFAPQPIGTREKVALEAVYTHPITHALGTDSVIIFSASAHLYPRTADVIFTHAKELWFFLESMSLKKRGKHANARIVWRVPPGFDENMPFSQTWACISECIVESYKYAKPQSVDWLYTTNHHKLLEPITYGSKRLKGDSPFHFGFEAIRAEVQSILNLVSHLPD